MTDEELAKKANLRRVKSAIIFISKSISELGVAELEVMACEDPLSEYPYLRICGVTSRLHEALDALDKVRESLEKENDLADEVVYGDVPLHSEWMDLDTPVMAKPEKDMRDAFDECVERMGKREIDRRFTFHPPKEGQGELYDAIRHSARDMAVCIRDLCPECEEKDNAMDALDMATMWANAAIARS